MGVKSCSFHQSTSTTLPPIEKDSKGIFYENYIVEYSLNDENLFLSSDARDELGIPVMVVTLDPTQNKCFGNSLSRYFLENFIGYDELLYASFKAVAQFVENRGFLRNVITWKHCTVMGKTQRDRASYILSFFIMIVITSLISLYMRYLNYQLILSLDYLLNHFNGEIGLLKFYACFMGFMGLVSLIWLYFKDLDALFYVMLIVVTAEMYYAAFTQCPTTKKHWPKFFYLYLFAFYAYDYRFDGQYRPMSLACSWSFILHSMIYFYHHVELPNVLWQIELQEIIIQRRLQQLRQQDRTASRHGFRAP